MAKNPMVNAIIALGDRMPKHESTGSLRGILNQMRMRAQALDTVNANRSPLDTPAAHALKVAKMARIFDREVTSAINQSVVVHRESLAAVDQRIADKINLRPDDFSKEVREVFRSLPAKQRIDFLGKLVDENRGPELAAIVKAPLSLTGINEEIRSRFEQAIVAKHAAPELEERANLVEAMESVCAASSAAGRYVKELTDPGKLAGIERAAAASAASDAAFDPAFGRSLQQ